MVEARGENCQRVTTESPAKRRRYVKRQDFWRVPHFFRDMEADFDEEEECPSNFQDWTALLGYATLSACILTLILLDVNFPTVVS